MKRLKEQIFKWMEEGESFNDIFFITVGWMKSTAEHDPDSTYTAKEVAELFGLLSDVKHDKAV